MSVWSHFAVLGLGLLIKPVLALFLFLTILHHTLLSRFGFYLRLNLLPHLLRPTVYLRSAAKSGVPIWRPFLLFLAGLSILIFFPNGPIWIGLACFAFGFFHSPRNHFLFLLFQDLFSKKKEAKGKSKFTFPSEEARFIHPDYPLLRSTTKFLGEKRFSIRIDPDEKPHIVFCFLESFRFKSLRHAPHFRELSSQGIFFPRFYANSPYTERALVSSLFGIPYSQTRSCLLRGYEDLPLIGLPKLFKDIGYRTAMIRGAKMENIDFANAHGFETVLDRSFFLKEDPGASCTSWGVHDEAVFRTSANWLAGQKKSAFLTLISLSSHYPWMVPSGWTPPPDVRGDCFHESYAYTDEMLGNWIKQLSKLNLLERSILFIFGDHGQGLGEHGPHYITRDSFYEEWLRVPLLIYAPGRVEKPMVIDEPCSQIDLLPTVLDLFGSKAPHHSLGTSLLRKKKRFLFFSVSWIQEGLAGGLGRWKAIISKGKEELYDLEADPEEQCNLAEVYPKRTKRFKRILEERSASIQELYRKKAFAMPGEELHFSPPKQIDDRTLAEQLSKRKELFSLDLSNCMRISGEEIGFSNLRKLDLSGCLNINFSLLGSRHPKLLMLNLSYCPFLTDGALDELLGQCRDLETLLLKGNELKRIGAKPLQSLSELNLQECLSLDASWIDWISALPSLDRLNVSCFGWSDSDFCRLKGGSWSFLALNHCQHIKIESVVGLLERCRHLRSLFLRDCPISEEELRGALRGNAIERIYFYGEKKSFILSV